MVNNVVFLANSTRITAENPATTNLFVAGIFFVTPRTCKYKFFTYKLAPATSRRRLRIVYEELIIKSAALNYVDFESNKIQYNSLYLRDL